ncbi:hypothetical protein ACQR16_17615 [Bradyrhizobium oligotrophicum]|uniref:hypothetical protein n=1 Tax=Bradyrhizobium oligotrophicum TaxID=44255 RepID=UPI003EBD1E7B
MYVRRVELSHAERDELMALLGDGKHATRKLERTQILLAAGAGSRDEEIARTVSVSLSTVGRTTRRFAIASFGIQCHASGYVACEREGSI